MVSSLSISHARPSTSAARFYPFLRVLKQFLHIALLGVSALLRAFLAGVESEIVSRTDIEELWKMSSYSEEEEAFLANIRAVGRKMGSLDRCFADVMAALKADSEISEEFIMDVEIAFERGVVEGVFLREPEEAEEEKNNESRNS